MKEDNPILHGILYVIVIVISVVFIVGGYFLCKVKTEDMDEIKYYSAKVTEITDRKEDTFDMGDGSDTQTVCVYYDAEIRSGSKKGDTVNADQYINDMYGTTTREVKEGDKIIIAYTYSSASENSSGKEWTYISHNRLFTVGILAGAFLLMILILGRLKGVTTIVSLVFTALAIFLVYIPSIIKGYNIYLSTTIISVFIVLMSLIIINGFDQKTLCAIVGNLCGVLVAGLLALLMNRVLHITGLLDEDYIYITQIAASKPINLKAIVWGGIIIGSLGAVMDVAMSISSSMYELSRKMRRRSYRNLLRSGMNIGRDAIATMTNTLILAYVGSCLSTIILYMAYNKNLLFLLNLEMITVEILQAVVGSMGILFAVPATALFAAFIYDN